MPRPRDDQEYPGGDDDYGAVGIWLFGSNNEVAHNKMLNCIAPSYDYEYDGGMVEIYGDVDSCYVHHNWGENCVGAFEVGGKGQTLTDNTIAYRVAKVIFLDLVKYLNRLRRNSSVSLKWTMKTWEIESIGKAAYSSYSSYQCDDAPFHFRL